MSNASRAVFLSYASQDAAAARRICEALRAAGVEVWFDQSELRGGDSWDAKIRKQIKECALFVPVISANTNVRPEGYFRLEWKLAVDRSHLLADDHPFLFPIAIGDVNDATARVPDKFREVQWTRLRLDETPSEIAARIDRLLRGGAEAGHAPRAGAAAASPFRPARRWAWWMVFPIVGTVVGLAFAVLPMWRVLNGTQAKRSRPVAGSVSRTSELARRTTIETRDQLEAALATARRATEKTLDSAPAWAALARLEGQFIRRGWDISEARRQVTQAAANRALALDPHNTDAANALAIVLLHQRAFTQVEALMRAAIARSPNDRELRGALGGALSGQGRDAEALAVREESLRLFPNDPLAHYDLALSYEKRPTPDFDAALRKFEDSLALQRLTSTVLHQAALLAGWKGDLVAARKVLDELDPLERTGDRAVGTSMAIGLLEHKPERTIEAAGLTARSYFEDDYVPGPKAWLLAHAYAMAGKRSLAEAQWREAAAVLRQRIAAKPGDWFDEAGLAVTLAWSGAGAEAAQLMAPLESVARESPQPLRMLYLSYYFAGLGDAVKTAPHLRAIVNRRELLTDKTLAIDPWWGRLRGKPEFEALRAEAAERRSEDAKVRGKKTAELPPAPDSKSVAVLAFRQLSADPDNEYLCEAISDELCSVLGRVPGLKVAASASAFSFKGKRVRPSEMAAQLGVAYLVDGTVQKIGSRLRVRAQLIKATDESPVWSSANLDHEMKDLFAVQDEVVGAIAKNLQLQLGAGTVRPAVAVNAEAFRLYYEGRRAWNLRSPEGFARAEALFNQAIEADPNFAHAYVGLADVWELSSGRKDHAKAMSHVQRALAIDPGLAEAHATLGTLQKAQFAGFRDAETSFRTAIKLNPNYASAYQWLGRFLETDGRLEEGLAMERKAMELDPLSSRIADNYGRALWMAGRLPEALEVLERAVVLLPENDQARCWRAWVWHALGRRAEALEEAPRLAVLPGWLGAIFASRIYYAAGMRREGDALFAKIDQTDDNHAHVFLTAAVRGDDVGALFSAKHLGPGSNAMYYFMPEFEGLRRDPRFLREIDAAGLRPAFERAVAERAKLGAAAKR